MSEKKPHDGLTKAVLEASVAARRSWDHWLKIGVNPETKAFVAAVDAYVAASTPPRPRDITDEHWTSLTEALTSDDAEHREWAVSHIAYLNDEDPCDLCGRTRTETEQAVKPDAPGLWWSAWGDLVHVTEDGRGLQCDVVLVDGPDDGEGWPGASPRLGPEVGKMVDCCAWLEGPDGKAVSLYRPSLAQETIQVGSVLRAVMDREPPPPLTERQQEWLARAFNEDLDLVRERDEAQARIAAALQVLDDSGQIVPGLVAELRRALGAA